MKAYFADTFYFLALFNPGDLAHRRATELSRDLRRPLVTTEWVLTELADGISDTSWRRMFRAFVASFQADPRATIVAASTHSFHRAVELYDARPDKEWSLTDCLSCIVMQDLQLTDALTGDHHFEQAGFTALLKD